MNFVRINAVRTKVVRTNVVRTKVFSVLFGFYVAKMLTKDIQGGHGGGVMKRPR